jgi:D-arabinose 1-dehydrogenase-like Zn-dependent alcohol dehydrogenase
VQLAKAKGYKVVAIDNRKEGLELAAELPLKADLIVDFNDSDAADRIKKWSGGGGLGGILVCTDTISAIHWSSSPVRTRGTIVLIGLPTDPAGFDSFDIIFQEKTVKGSLVSTQPETAEMMKVVDKFGIKSHVTTIPLAEAATKLPDAYMDPHLKGRVVVTM